MDDSQKTKLELAVEEARRAIDFFDRVKRSSFKNEKITVGRDHWDWLESVVRNVATVSVAEHNQVVANEVAEHYQVLVDEAYHRGADDQRYYSGGRAAFVGE
jgi:hypothetical protein